MTKFDMDERITIANITLPESPGKDSFVILCVGVTQIYNV